MFVHNRKIFKTSLTMEYFFNIFYIDNKKVLDKTSSIEEKCFYRLLAIRNDQIFINQLNMQ